MHHHALKRHNNSNACHEQKNVHMILIGGKGPSAVEPTRVTHPMNLLLLPSSLAVIDPLYLRLDVTKTHRANTPKTPKPQNPYAVEGN
jgi:hypothetical protein